MPGALNTNGKTANKTAKPSGRNGNALPIGAHPGNTGGKPGRSGRLPDAFKELCRELVSRDETVNAVGRILKDADHPAFIGALKWATEHGYGKAKETLEHSGPGGEPLRRCVWLVGGREIEF